MARGLFVRQPVVVLLSSPLQPTLQPSAVAEATPNELVHAILHNGQSRNYTAKIFIISGNRNIAQEIFENVAFSFKTSCYVIWIHICRLKVLLCHREIPIVNIAVVQCYRHRVEALVLDEERRHVGRVEKVVAVGIDTVPICDHDVRYAHVLINVNG